MSGIVLLIASLNLANMLLARGAARQGLDTRMAMQVFDPFPVRPGDARRQHGGGGRGAGGRSRGGPRRCCSERTISTRRSIIATIPNSAIAITESSVIAANMRAVSSWLDRKSVV
mgnify:CR=1 FL=1